MECLSRDPILQFQPDTLEEVRKAYDLDNVERMEQSINILEDWIKNQNHFTQKKFDRAHLERALIVTKGSVERAKTQIDSMCTFRTLLPKYFKYCNLREDLKSILHKSWVIPLPQMTKDYHRVYIMKVNATEMKPHDYTSFFAFNVIVCEYLKAHDYIKGIIIILDIRNVNLLEIVRKLSITEFQEFFAIVVKGFGARLKDIYVVNEQKMLDLVVQVAKYVLSEKLLTRLKYYADIESVHEHIDPSILPSELGGTERSLDVLRSEWIDVLSSEEHVEYMRRMSQAKTDETSRLQEKFNSLYLGTPGSFRNLIVD